MSKEAFLKKMAPRKTPGNPVIMRSAALRHGRVRPCA